MSDERASRMCEHCQTPNCTVKIDGKWFCSWFCMKEYKENREDESREG
jgi:hypothetical protein